MTDFDILFTLLIAILFVGWFQRHLTIDQLTKLEKKIDALNKKDEMEQRKRAWTKRREKRVTGTTWPLNVSFRGGKELKNVVFKAV